MPRSARPDSFTHPILYNNRASSTITGASTDNNSLISPPQIPSPQFATASQNHSPFPRLPPPQGPLPPIPSSAPLELPGHSATSTTASFNSNNQRLSRQLPPRIPAENSQSQELPRRNNPLPSPPILPPPPPQQRTRIETRIEEPNHEAEPREIAVVEEPSRARHPPVIDTMRTQLALLPHRVTNTFQNVRNNVRDSFFAFSHEVNEQLAPRHRPPGYQASQRSQRRRAAAATAAAATTTAASPSTRANVSSSLSNRPSRRSTPAPYNDDLMPPTLAVIGLVTSFLVFISLVIFVRYSQFAANIVGIAYSVAVLIASSVVVVRYWLEKRLQKAAYNEQRHRRGGGGGGLENRRFGSLRRITVLRNYITGRPDRLHGRNLNNADHAIEAGEPAEEMEMRGEIIVVPVNPVNRSGAVMDEHDDQLPAYSPPANGQIRVT